MTLLPNDRTPCAHGSDKNAVSMNHMNTVHTMVFYDIQNWIEHCSWVYECHFIDDSLCQWSLTINVHSCIYEHTSCMINDHRNSYEHWSSMIIDIDYDSWRSMIVAMKCCWSYMISVDHCIISWPLASVQNNSASLHTVTVHQLKKKQCTVAHRNSAGERKV